MEGDKPENQETQKAAEQPQPTEQPQKELTEKDVLVNHEERLSNVENNIAYIKEILLRIKVAI